MNAKRLLTIAVVSMLMIGGVAALGAAAPAEQASDNASSAGDDLPAEAGDNVSTDADTESEANDETPGAASERSVGPSDGLPAQAPDHVSEIHDRIDSFLNGSIDTLGDSLGDLLGGGSAADNADNENTDAAGEDVDENAAA